MKEMKVFPCDADATCFVSLCRNHFGPSIRMKRNLNGEVVGETQAFILFWLLVV